MSLLARLAEEGYRPWEIRRLTRWYIKRVVFHPREKSGKLILPEPEVQEFDQLEHIRKQLRRWNCPWWLIERRAREYQSWANEQQGLRMREG